MLLTFLLIMQANDVIDLLLNFTAMEFVTNLDGIAFKLAENGYLWSAGEDTARAVTNTRFEKTSKRRVLKRWPHVFMAFVLYSLFVLVVYRQTNRVYGDNIVYIQFTDAIVPWLGTLSGSYVGTRKQAIRNLFGKNADVGIIVYEKKDQKEYCQDSGIPDCKRAFFFYCMKVKEWRFDLVGSTTDLNCDNWILRGSNDEPKLGDKYDILSHSSANWFAQDPKAEKKKALRDEVAVIKSFKAADYKEQELATLEATGVLFDAPYYKIVEDGSRVHDRPVYETFDLEFLAFNGYRWLLVRYDETECAQNCTRRRDDCFHFCLSTFDPFYSRYNASLISHPMELQTSGDTWVPSEELMWFPVTGEGNATQPDLEVKALPVLVSETIDIFENPEGLKDLSVEAAAKRLFAESSRLNKPTSEMPCEAGETSLVIELRTDLWPEETKMLVMEMKELMASFDAYNYREEEPDVAKLNFARAIFKNNTIPNDPLELAGHRSTFSLDDSSKTNVWGFYGGRKDKITTYRYGTCLPSTSCVGVLLHDKFSDDIALPGKFELYLDSKRVDLNKRTTQYCMYELGPSCATTVDCF
ncbi:unnamed protein product [Cylindrotheca closterium]|uniref:Uncharacterized protein n=1 Tax=Cylindrotheca closterium TaxID=2856 RepID=A0AAD2G7J0_9STRA|nr:unnamed protein product [Cylindrotheca closterium]